jgi:hypothetical protein
MINIFVLATDTIGADFAWGSNCVVEPKVQRSMLATYFGDGLGTCNGILQCTGLVFSKLVLRSFIHLCQNTPRTFIIIFPTYKLGVAGVRIGVTGVFTLASRVWY